MALDLKWVLMILVVLIITFITSSAIILPFFASVFEYGFGTEPCAKTGCKATSTSASLINSYCSTPTATPTACSNCNTTTGYSAFLSTCASEIAWDNNTHCNSCSNFGFKSATTGLMLFILFIGIIALILLVITKVLPKFR